MADHFGEEAVAYLAEPLLAGVYGGSPDDLSAVSVLPKFVEYEQRFGSVVVGTLRDKRKPSGQSIFKTLRHGMGTLIDALLGRVNVVRFKVESIAPAEAGWQVFAGGEWHGFDHVVLACGANKAAPLIAPVDARLAELLAAIKPRLDLRGLSERRAIMACTWLGTKWAGRVPADKAVFRCFSTDPDVAREAVLADLNRLMGMTSEPIFTINHRWPDSMPQYAVGHSVRVAEIDAHMSGLRGLSLIGNAFRGIGIPDCVRGAQEAARRIGAAQV